MSKDVPSTLSFSQFVGYSQDSRLPAEFDVTALLQPGRKNMLAVQVTQRPTGGTVECWDLHALSWRGCTGAVVLAVLTEPCATVEERVGHLPQPGHGLPNPCCTPAAHPLCSSLPLSECCLPLGR